MKSIFLALALGLSFTLPSFAQTSPPKRLTPEMRKAADQAFLKAYVRHVNRSVRTGEDIERELFPNLSAKDRIEMQSVFADIGAVPKLSLEGDTLIFHFADGDVRARWPDQKTGQFFFDGVSFTIDPSAPLKFQVDNFIAKMKAKGGKTHASFSLGLLPEAHAGLLKATWMGCEKVNVCKTIVTLSIGAAVATYSDSIRKGIYNIFCWSISGYKPWASGNIAFCRDWKKEADEWEKYIASQELKDDPNSEWVAGDPKCPKNDKGEETFDAWMAETVKLPNGEWETRDSWEHFVGKSKDSNLTEGYIFAPGKPTDDPKAAKMQFFFTKTDKPTLEAIRFPKSEGSDEKITIWATDLQKDLDVSYRGIFSRMRGLAEAAQAWVKTCRTLARAAKIRPKQTEQATKVMQQQPDEPTTSPTPAATSK